MSKQRCEECGRRFDRPGFWSRCADRHPAPDLAQKIVEDIECAIHQRKGIGWEMLDSEIIDEIRDDLTAVVRARIEPIG